jgi:hypothetical protein
MKFARNEIPALGLSGILKSGLGQYAEPKVVSFLTNLFEYAF